MNVFIRALFPLMAVLALQGVSSLALAQDAHDHSHDAAHAHEEHGGAAVLSLNHGEPWETDEALRHGMTEIRAAVDMVTPAFNAGQLSAQQGQQLSEAIQGSVNTMIEQCELPPDADANLHVILAALLSGASAVNSLPQSKEGVPALKEALETYGHYFHHPGWQADEHAGHSH